MIAYLVGTVREVEGALVVLVVNGIGFAIATPMRYQLQPEEKVELEIYTHVTQDKGSQLFGFKTRDEKRIFSLVLDCSGIGPKIAISVLNMLTPSLFTSAIMTGDIKTLSKIDGVGTKKAETLVMYLKDKITKVKLTDKENVLSAGAQQVKKLSDVLVQLGYNRPEIVNVLERLRPEFDRLTFDEMLRKALGFLART